MWAGTKGHSTNSQSSLKHVNRARLRALSWGHCHGLFPYFQYGRTFLTSVRERCNYRRLRVAGFGDKGPGDKRHVQVTFRSWKQRIGFPTRASIKGHNSTITNFGPIRLLLVGLLGMERKVIKSCCFGH